MTEEQLAFVRALLALAIEMDGVMGTDEWLGDERWATWTRADTEELDKLLDEVSHDGMDGMGA